MGTDNLKTCVILLNMGGPENLNDIRRYLYNIFTDRSIIRFPLGAIFQKPFAWMISGLRKKKVREHYRLIGGSSPLLKWTQTQADNIENILKNDCNDFKCFIGMRYFDPFIMDTIHEAYAEGYRRFLFHPLYPQFSAATTGSSFTEAKRVCDSFSDIETTFINDFHDNSEYIELLKNYISTNMQENQILLFSAHSLPKKFVDEGDPYVDQINKTAALAADGKEYFVSFQSRTGPVEWVGPDTIVEAKRLLNDRSEDIFIVPISFVSDHIETLYEIDIELKELMGQANSNRLYRMPMFNDDRKFGNILANIIKKSGVC